MEPLLGKKAAGGGQFPVNGRKATTLVLCASAAAAATVCSVLLLGNGSSAVRRNELIQEVDSAQGVPAGAAAAGKQSQLGFVTGKAHHAPFPPGELVRSVDDDAMYDADKFFAGYQPKAVVWGEQDGPAAVADGHRLDDEERFHTGYRWPRKFDVRDYAFDPNENGVRRDRQGFYMDWEQGKDLDGPTNTAGFEDMDMKAPTIQLANLAQEGGQPYDFDPFPYAVETAQHVVGEQNYGPEGSRPDDDQVKSKEPWPFARAPRSSQQLAQGKLAMQQQLTMRQDEAGLKARPTLGRMHGCKPEQIRFYPEDDCDPLLTNNVYPAEEAIRKRIKEEPYDTFAHVHWTAGDVPPMDDALPYVAQDGSQTGWKDAVSEAPEPTLPRPVIAVGPGNLDFPIGTKGKTIQSLSKKIDSEVAGLFGKAMKRRGGK